MKRKRKPTLLLKEKIMNGNETTGENGGENGGKMVVKMVVKLRIRFGVHLRYILSHLRMI